MKDRSREKSVPSRIPSPRCGAESKEPNRAVKSSTHVERSDPSGCCASGSLWGWSPPPLPADTALKRVVDRLLPRAGFTLLAYFAAVIVLLNVGLILPARADLAAIGVAGLAAGGWCALNFWRSRHAHCLVTGGGWLALAMFAFVEVGIGHSLIHGDEGLVFLSVLGAGLAFEALWFLARRTNAVTP